jgi:tetratricopeptide (TPR) repeat protein
MKIFISYRHVQPDSRFLKRLQTHLASIDDQATIWADSGIEPGEEWRKEIDEAIAACDIAILLVSADSIASPFIRGVELPTLLDAHREGRIRLIPLFVGPSSVLPPGIAEIQGANTPGKPLVAMSRARQEATLADLVKWLGTYRTDVRNGASRNDTTTGARFGPLERVPAAGLLFDRAEIQGDISRFLRSANQRLCVIHGFPGVGKTSLAATLVDRHREQFAGAFWLTCRPMEQPSVALLENLASFLESHGNGWVRTLLSQLPELDDYGLTRLIARMVEALTAHAYLFVLDDFHTFLDPANQLLDNIVKDLLSQMARVPGNFKILLLSDRRPSWEGGFDRFPTGAALERELSGLPDEAVSELIDECGLDSSKTGVPQAVGTYLAGNPALIKVYCSYVARRRGDPVTGLAAATTKGPVAVLISEVLTDLRGKDRKTLERLAVLRMPLNWDNLERFGLEAGQVVPLLDSWLVVLDPSSHTLTLPPAIRDFLLGATPRESLREAHSWAAEGYGHVMVTTPRSYSEVRPHLEFGHHSTEAGDVDAGAAQVLVAVELLISWGYAELAKAEIERIAAQVRDESIVARCEVQLGRVYDQRGRLDDALEHYESAVRLAEHAEDNQTLADAFFRRGRIRNARQEFDAAQRDFERCIELCRAFGLGRPEPRARLALAWARKERGAPEKDVVAAFEDALALADAQGDWPTASDAHRQLGFISWVGSRDRQAAARHYDTALRIALDHSLAKEIGAVHKELTYLASEWGDHAAAEEHFRASVESSGLLQDAYLLPGAKTNQALMLMGRGDLAGARGLLEESVRAFAEQENPGGEAYALHELARLEAEQGAKEDASAHLERAHRLCLDHGLTLQCRKIEATARALAVDLGRTG